MKNHKALFSVIILTLVMGFLSLGTLAADADTGLKEYLPKAGEPTGWAPSGKPQYAKGEDLFTLINGGAEVYHEYGFKQAIIQSYKNKKFSFNLEIYEMKSTDAAYGVYSFKTGHSGKTLDNQVGTECLLEDYYLNMRKGNFLVTVIGFDSKPETLDALVKTAKNIASKIPAAGEKPALLKLVPEQHKEERIFNGIIYMRGNLALFNQYPLDSKNIFNLTDGMVVLYKKAKFFIFKYADNAESKKWFKQGSAVMKNNGKYKGFAMKEIQFQATDKKERQLMGQLYKNYILILINEKDSKIKTVHFLTYVKQRISKNISHGG